MPRVVPPTFEPACECASVLLCLRYGHMPRMARRYLAAVTGDTRWTSTPHCWDSSHGSRVHSALVGMPDSHLPRLSESPNWRILVPVITVLYVSVIPSISDPGQECQARDQKGVYPRVDREYPSWTRPPGNDGNLFLNAVHRQTRRWHRRNHRVRERRGMNSPARNRKPLRG